MPKTFEIEPLDPRKLVKVNDLPRVSNPVFFNKFGQPTSDGLLSNEIFGITKGDRSTSYAYIDLGETFISPPFYKAWCRLDSKIKGCVHQTDKYKINSEGKLEVDKENGNNGIKWLKENYDKFKWKENESFTHNQDIKYMHKFKNEVFIDCFPVIPAYYRDVESSGGQRVQVGAVNELYNQLILATKSLSESKDYGLTLSGAIRGRIQETILEIYNWFGEEPQIGRKFGILRRASMAKTTDYSSRLVMTAPKLNVENMEDLTVDCDHASIPLASLAVNFFPFVIFHMRRFFENQFAGRMTFTNLKDGKEYPLENYQLFYSEDELKKQIDRFIHGYSNRFIPVPMPIKSKNPIHMRMTGKIISPEDATAYIRNKKPLKDVESSTILDRDLTWCDIIFIAVTEAVKDRMVLITRYPMDSYFNQVPMKVNVSSTMETEAVIINNKLYRHYPKIRQSDIGKDTSNTFVDTMNLCNVYLKSIGGDYDGDTCSVKGIYSDEANAELQEQLKKPLHWIGLDGQLAIFAHAQAIDAVYALTLGVPDMKKLTDPIF